MGKHERFAAWQHSHQLVLLVYRLTSHWPKHEAFGLTSQARRASVSVAANLAEGAAKRGAREFCRFLDISLGSLAELEYLLRLATDLGYLAKEDIGTLHHRMTETAKSVWGLYAAVKRRAPRT